MIEHHGRPRHGVASPATYHLRMDETMRCRVCGSKVRLESLSEAKASAAETRVCTNPECPTNTGTARVGDSV